MNQTATITPTTLGEVLSTNNYIKAKTQAQAYATVGTILPSEHGPIVSRKLFAELPAVVYEYYRVKFKQNKIYVIF